MATGKKICRIYLRAEKEEGPDAQVQFADGFLCKYIDALDYCFYKFPLSLSYWYPRWRIYCILKGAWSYPRVLVFIKDKDIVHYSFVLPRLGRIDGMDGADLEIGPCRTEPAARNKGLFSRAIMQIIRDHQWEHGVFWMVVREENEVSRFVIEKNNFTHIYDATKMEVRFPKRHRYVLDSVNSRFKSLRTSRQIRDQLVEKEKYDEVSRRMKSGIMNAGHRLGLSRFKEYLREPYEEYYKLMNARLRPGARVLDLCCGDGLHTIEVAKCGAEVVAVDISQESLNNLSQIATSLNLNIRTVCTSVEELDLEWESFDVVTCTGGISYVDNELFLDIAYKYIKPGGHFIAVDSLNNSIIYRLNRYIHYLFKQRTYSTLERMPSERLISRYGEVFQECRVSYYGILVFMAPLLGRMFGEKLAREFVSWSDGKLRFLKRQSFKFIIQCRK